MKILQRDQSQYISEVTFTPIPIGESVSFTTSENSFLYLRQDVTYGGYNNFTINSPLYYGVSSDTPAVFSITNGVATRLQSGHGTVRLSGSSFAITETLDFRSQTLTNTSFTAYKTGTIGYHSAAALEAELDDDKDLNYYNGNTYASCTAQAGGIARNANCWAADFDFSGVPVTHLFGGFWGGGAMITSRHLACSYHYAPSNKVGTVLRFVGSDGTVVTRTIIAQSTGSNLPPVGLGLSNPAWPDVGDVNVYLLNAAVPASVKVYPVVGNWMWKNVSAPFQIDGAGPFLRNRHLYYSCITTNQSRHIKTAFTAYTSTNQPTFSEPYETFEINGREWQSNPDAWAIWSIGESYYYHPDFRSNAIEGDSGSPVFLPYADKSMALFSFMTFPTSGGSIYAAKMNAMILDADANASPPAATGLTVTVAPDPTL